MLSTQYYLAQKEKEIEHSINKNTVWSNRSDLRSAIVLRAREFESQRCRQCKHEGNCPRQMLGDHCPFQGVIKVVTTIDVIPLKQAVSSSIEKKWSLTTPVGRQYIIYNIIFQITFIMTITTSAD